MSDRIELDFSTGYNVNTTLAHLHDCANGCSVIRSLAEQITRQTKPPRIPEPGLWGVVEAGDEGLKRRTWVRVPENTAGNNWTSTDGWARVWDELIDPVLVRDGIEDAS